MLTIKDLMTISGLQPTDAGSITFEGNDLLKITTDQRVASSRCWPWSGR
jgi:ABC-type branched-subunit amino acid transport system ATPase component